MRPISPDNVQDAMQELTVIGMFGLVHLSHPRLGGSPWSGGWDDPHGSLRDALDTNILVGLSLGQEVDQQQNWKLNAMFSGLNVKSDNSSECSIQ